MALTLISPPEAEPLTLDDLEAQCRADLTAEATLATGYLLAARMLAEERTRRALVTQVWELSLDAFPVADCAIILPLPPLQTVDSIKYIDAAGVEQTLDPLAYKVGTYCEFGRIVPAYGRFWPVARDEIEAVKVRFTCGYGPVIPDPPVEGVTYPDNVPQPIKNWILLNAANLAENRESVVVGESRVVELATLADSLLAPYTVVRI